MKFRLTTTMDYDASEILLKYPVLLKEFEVEIVCKKLYVILNGIEDLMKLSKICGQLIVSAGNVYCDTEDSIEIYDDYRE